MGNQPSIKPPRYSEDVVEVYISYTTDDGEEINQERVYLDIAVEVLNPRLHFYDVIDKWILALPGAYHELSDIIPGELTNWSGFVRTELNNTKLLKEMKLLSRCSTLCNVTLKNNHGITKFDSFLTRNLYSLMDKEIYATEADTLTPIRYPDSILSMADEIDYSYPLSYLLLVQPLLWEIRILANQGYVASKKSYVVAKHSGKTIVRLLCLGNNIIDMSNQKDDTENYYTLALEPLRQFLSIFLIGEGKLGANEVRSIIDGVIDYYVKYIQTVGYHAAYGQLAILNKRHEFVNCKLEKEILDIGNTPEERTIQLFEAVKALSQSKRYIVELFYQGIDIFHSNGLILIYSIRYGGDYMLRLMSLIPGRLEKFLSYARPATQLLLTSCNKSFSASAFEYILSHDHREGRENSISYNKLIEKMRKLLQYQKSIREDNPWLDKRVTIYIKYKAPMYETFQ